MAKESGIEVLSIEGPLADALGSKVAAFYAHKGLCCDD